MKLQLRRFKYLPTLMFLIISALLVAAACNPDDKNRENTNGANSKANDDITRYDVNDGAITVTYKGQTHTADRDTTGQITRTPMFNQLITAFQSDWGEQGKLPYNVSTVVILTEEPGKDIHPGEYEIFDQDEILLQEARLGSISLFSADLHDGLNEELPASLTAVSGTIQYELIDAENNGPKTAIYTFNASFLSDREDDDTLYEISGKLTAAHQLAN